MIQFEVDPNSLMPATWYYTNLIHRYVHINRMHPTHDISGLRLTENMSWVKVAQHFLTQLINELGFFFGKWNELGSGSDIVVHPCKKINNINAVERGSKEIPPNKLITFFASVCKNSTNNNLHCTTANVFFKTETLHSRHHVFLAMWGIWREEEGQKRVERQAKRFELRNGRGE